MVCYDWSRNGRAGPHEIRARYELWQVNRSLECLKWAQISKPFAADSFEEKIQRVEQQKDYLKILVDRYDNQANEPESSNT